MSSTATNRSGYICKRCGGPSPIGVGYASSEPGAYEASEGRAACDCGCSRAVQAAAADLAN